MLTPYFPLQRVWFRLAKVIPYKGPVLGAWLPRNQSCVARPRTRTMAGYSDRCAWQCSSRDSGPRVPRLFSPRSYNHLSHYRPNNVLYSSLRNPLAWSRSDCYYIKIYGLGRQRPGQQQWVWTWRTFIGIWHWDSAGNCGWTGYAVFLRIYLHQERHKGNCQRCERGSAKSTNATGNSSQQQTASGTRDWADALKVEIRGLLVVFSKLGRV